MDEMKKNGIAPAKKISRLDIMELKRKMEEKLEQAQIEERYSKMQAQEALSEQLEKMDKDEKKFGYESTNLYKFNDDEQSKIMNELTGDDGMKLAESMLDSMSSLQTKEDMQVRIRNRNSHRGSSISTQQKRHAKRKHHHKHNKSNYNRQQSLWSY